MDAWPPLARVLGMIAEQKYDEASGLCLAALADTDIDGEFLVQALSLLSVSEHYRGDFGAAMLAAERAVAVADVVATDTALLFALPTRSLASAGIPPLPDTATSPSLDAFDRAWERRDGLWELSVEMRAIAGRILLEAAFVTGRFDAARELDGLLEDVWETPLGGPGEINPMIYFMQLFSVRLGVFQGRIPEAFEGAERARERALANGHAIGIFAATAALCFVAGHRGDPGVVRELADEVVTQWPEPKNHLAAGGYFLAAYGLLAVGDSHRAAELVLRGGGGDRLPWLQTGDRALGYEVLIVDALDSDEIEAAQRWSELLMPLGALPMAEPTVARVLGRLDLALGDALSGAEHAEVAIARARLRGSYLEETMASLLQARSLAQAGVRDRAIASLNDIARSTDRVGSLSARREAARQLRRLGRRAPPGVHAGWSGLSERERQIAMLAAEGHSNRIIGASLFLSERTVQSHLSRILAALGVTTRSSLPRVLASQVSVVLPSELPAELTPRQWDVVELVVEGVANGVMAARLGISVKTVEKHIGAIFLRWGVSSRTGVASIAVGERGGRSALG